MAEVGSDALNSYRLSSSKQDTSVTTIDASKVVEGYFVAPVSSAKGNRGRRRVANNTSNFHKVKLTGEKKLKHAIEANISARNKDMSMHHQTVQLMSRRVTPIRT